MPAQIHPLLPAHRPGDEKAVDRPLSGLQRFGQAIPGIILSIYFLINHG